MLPYYLIGFYLLCLHLNSLKEKTLLKFFLTHTTGNEEILSQANSGALLAECVEEAPTSCKKETGEKKNACSNLCSDLDIHDFHILIVILKYITFKYTVSFYPLVWKLWTDCQLKALLNKS